jgi:hypothetical protein
MSGNQAARGTIMQYLKHRSAAWWILAILQGLGFAAFLLLLIILFAMAGA